MAGSKSDSVIRFEQVSKSYAIYERPSDRLRELATLGRLKRHRDFKALDDVSFSVRRGETFCIIGENGSGKSTMLQIIAGILQPSAGIVQVEGRVAALLELGSGFNPEFSGRDNVYLNAAILGLTHAETERRFHAIEEFAEIGDFLDQPVKTYSSGMAVRLAFAVAIHVDPEILLVDEALAVGDVYFRQRCLRKVHELRQHGVTILFVSHSMGDIKAIGDRVLWLDRGSVRDLGTTDLVISKYLAEMNAKDSSFVEHQAEHRKDQPRSQSQPPQLVTSIPNIDHRHGDGRAEIIGIAVLNEHGEPAGMLEPNTKAIVRISARAHQDIALPNIGFMMRNHLGIDFAGSNTLREGYELDPMQPGDTLTIDFHIEFPELYPSHFSFSPAIADGTLLNYRICDWIDNALILQMGHAEGQIYGYLHLPCRIEVNAKLGRGEVEVKRG
ncbi:MAG: Wzt carbohydrate-binding domain-containing protein [Bryobacter sp.]|nr:Wzt carbohydrate-binding domain-containing protein [Bryobacter sp. CoA8 C33]